MRLLDVGTGEFTLFTGSDTPAYATLSHTWGDDEITFNDLETLSQPELEKRKGYSKLKSARWQAILDGYGYIWIDTCCIDKSNAAELSEAINSMFHWYRNSAVCYAYLSDVVLNTSGPPLSEDSLKFNISQSRWFTRGWTLQELLAPQTIEFFGHPWTHLGSREKFATTITRTTGIPKDVLLDPSSATRFSIAQRMSWAANRKTTILEDEAYCLLGLFNVTMPLLYGEGYRAFIRLQVEIMKQTTDMSLFAWGGAEAAEFQVGGVLADHPSAFASSGKVVVNQERPKGFCMTWRNTLMVRLSILTLPAPWENGSGIFTTAVLPCHLTDRPNQIMGLPLTKLDPEEPWARILGGNRGLVDIPRNMAKRAKFETIELDLNVSFIHQSARHFLEYHGKLDFSNLIQNASEQQILWNPAMEKVISESPAFDDASKPHVLTRGIQVSDTDCWDGTRTSLAGNVDRSHQHTHYTISQPHGSEQPGIASPLAIAASEGTHRLVQILLDLGKGNSGIQGSIVILNRASGTVKDDDFFGRDVQHEICARSECWENGFEEKTSRNSNDTEGDSRHQSATNDCKAMNTKAVVACDEEGDEDEEDEEEDEEDEDDEEEGEGDMDVDDFQSFASDIYLDDTNSTASSNCTAADDTSSLGNAPLLDALLDVLVDIIIDRSNIMLRFSGKSQPAKKFSCPFNLVKDEWRRQGCRRKADTNEGIGDLDRGREMNKSGFPFLRKDNMQRYL
jgi:hypothetical protein